MASNETADEREIRRLRREKVRQVEERHSILQELKEQFDRQRSMHLEDVRYRKGKEPELDPELHLSRDIEKSVDELTCAMSSTPVDKGQLRPTQYSGENIESTEDHWSHDEDDFMEEELSRIDKRLDELKGVRADENEQDMENVSTIPKKSHTQLDQGLGMSTLHSDTERKRMVEQESNPTMKSLEEEMCKLNSMIMQLKGVDQEEEDHGGASTDRIEEQAHKDHGHMAAVDRNDYEEDVDLDDYKANMFRPKSIFGVNRNTTESNTVKRNPRYSRGDLPGIKQEGRDSYLAKQEHEKEKQSLESLGICQKDILYRKESNRKKERESLDRIKLLKQKEAELLRRERERKEEGIIIELEEELVQEKRLQMMHDTERVLKERIHEMQTRGPNTRKSVPGNTDNRFTKKVIFDQPQQHHGKPVIPSFSGADFEEWKMDVQSTIKSGLYADTVITQAVRNALKGQTRKLLLTIDPAAATKQILAKLEEIYGDIKTEDTILQEFMAAHQEESETVCDWGIRLESLMQVGIDRGELSREKKNSMLKQRFWRGLKSEEIKNATRVCYESSDGFDAVRRKARFEEEEIKRTLKSGTNTSSRKEAVQYQQTAAEKKLDDQMNLMKELLGRMRKLEGDVEKMNKARGKDEADRHQNARYRYNSRGRGRGNYIHPQQRWANNQRQWESRGNGAQYQNQPEAGHYDLQRQGGWNSNQPRMFDGSHDLKE